MLKELNYLICNLDCINSDKLAKEVLEFIESKGMLPPTCTVKIIPDPTRPGKMMHTETKREWDEENE